MKNDIHDLGLVLDSKIKLILIESWDEPRVLETLTSLAVRRGLGLHFWSITEGLQRLGFAGGSSDEATLEPEAALKLIKADPQANLYAMCDLHPFLDDNPKLVRLLKEVAMRDAPHAPTLVLVSHACKLPAEVQRFAARFSLALPSEDELLAIVREEATRWSERNRGARVRTDNRTLQQVVKNLRGMSHAEARILARNVICDDGAITQEDLPELNKAKFQLLDLEGVLSFEYDTARFADVGGLSNLKRWLAEQMAPCVLWMDEVEKGLASGDNDGGVSQRVLGTLLTWMAERKAPVFMVATANVIERLPPELVRKGRFDELFFVDLPDHAVRVDIFRIHLQRRELAPESFDLDLLATACAGFSGAEIEQVVVSALYAAQAQQQPVDQAMLLHSIQSTAPLSVVMAEGLEALRSWAHGRTVSAN